MKDENGKWCEDQEELQELVTRYFTKLFQSTGVEGRLSEREKVNRVTDEENAALMQPVTLEEVKDAVFSMHHDKSPGPDGLNPAFFQSFWSIIRRDVFKVCHDL